jgi:hypothetical protein
MLAMAFWNGGKALLRVAEQGEGWECRRTGESEVATTTRRAPLPCPDLEVLGEKIREIRDVLADLEGVADLQVEQTAGILLQPA